jgi:hypothetical protein
MKTPMFLKILAVAGVVALLTTTANADFTPVGTSGEPDHQEIFEQALGLPAGTLTGSPGTGFTGGGYMMTRVSDFPLAGNMNVTLCDLAGRTDQVWEDGLTSFMARARYASYGQAFGYSPVADPGWNVILEVNAQGYNPTTTYYVDMPLDLSGTWHWERDTTAEGGGPSQWSSLQSNNPGSRDHMVTYLVESPSITPLGFSWWVFWEDQDLGDADYNDLAVEITPIPAPGAALLGIIGLGLVSRIRRWVP